MSILSKKNLPHLEIAADDAAKHSLIFLHGLGADGHDFVPMVEELQLPASLKMRYLFPHAPLMPVTINQGAVMPAWYDISALSREGVFDQAGVASSVLAIESIIQAEVARGISTEHILLGGFSQGAVIALYTGLCYPQPLGGIIALSGYLPNAENVLKQASLTNHRPPIFIAHGTEDSIVPYAAGKAASVALNAAHYPVSWHRYAMAHSVCAEEINDMRVWIENRWQN